MPGCDAVDKRRLVLFGAEKEDGQAAEAEAYCAEFFVVFAEGVGAGDDFGFANFSWC